MELNNFSQGAFMFRIGLFSKINRITTKTLRHYDEVGLLKPEHIDNFTGYRYYTSEQLPKLHRILALKQMGLSLPDIKKVLKDTDSIEIILKLRENELKSKIETDKKMLLQVQNYKKMMRGEKIMKYNPVIKSLPEVIVASMSVVVPNYDAYFDIVPKMGEEMKRQGAECVTDPEYCFTIYHDGEYKDNDIHVEVCEAVKDYCEDSEMVKYKMIDKVNEAVCVLHKGPYSTIREAYAFAFKWLEENGYYMSEPPRESYIDGIWNKDDENEWLTELQIPVKTKK
jgi:DNA-binding transcriptional MerR regulator